MTRWQGVPYTGKCHVPEEVSALIRTRKHIWDLNENEKSTYQNLWDAAKAVLRENFTALGAYIWKEDLKINHLSFHLRILEKGREYRRKRKEIKIKAEINDTENGKWIEKNQQNSEMFFWQN